jgi:CAAX prenyl protease-like protein
MAFIAIADMFVRLGWTDDELRWLYPVKIAAVVIALLAYRPYYSELKLRPLSAGSTVTAVIAGFVVLVLWINLDAAWMQIGTAAGFDPRGNAGEIDWLLVAARIAGAAVVVPVMEELFWRSFLLRWMQSGDFLRVHPAAVGVRAVAVTVILFGFEHNLWLAGIVAGLTYSVLYMRTGTLWAPILAHAVTNGALGIWIVETGSWTYW